MIWQKWYNKLVKKLTSLLLTILFSVAPATPVFAQELGATGGAPSRDSIAQRCTFAQRYLNETLKPRDLKARVDRLQAYRYIYQRLDVFAARLERNNQQGAVEFRQSLDQLHKSTEAFKKDYEQYDATRDIAAKYENCQKQPDEFQEYINATRIAREKVSKDVADIHSLLDVSIMNQLAELHNVFLQTGGTGS